ncbi:cysteine--tRNA ligase [Longispora urticae]
MTLRLHDTATRSVRDFVPREPGKVGIYLCGITVQAGPHIGHMRSAINYDVLRRWLLHLGYEVRFVRNITDIDDKILAKALEANVPFWQIAYGNELLVGRMYDALGVLPATVEPRATGHIPEMFALIQNLVERGHAYAAEGNVYFDVRSWAPYGELSGQRPDAMLPTESGASGKRSPLDFALWKGEKPTEPADAYWDSQWGRGRPGWHIECSAMTWRYLGEEFDIHGGGLDIQFPHHENEVAQSKAAGFGFARHWVHHAMLNLGGEKMSKSVGNVLDLDALIAKGLRPIEVRYYIASPHYRSVIEYSDEAIQESAVAFRRIEGFVTRATELVGEVEPGELGAEFVAAMNDDLNTSRALAALHETIRQGNSALADGHHGAARRALASVRAMLGILGIDPLDSQWRVAGSDQQLKPAVDSLVALALEQRNAARARKDFQAADAVRDQLKRAGIIVEDTPNGPRWTLGS